MALWDKLKNELDRAGKAAQGALDEGKIRLEAFRTRQLADKAAQALGYAVYRARQGGAELDADTYARLSSTLAGHEAEAARLEAQLRDVSKRDPKRPDEPAAKPSGDGSAGGSTGSTGSTAGASSAPPPPEAPAP